MNDVVMNQTELLVDDLDVAAQRLRQQGWVVLDPKLLKDGPRPVVVRFGRIVPQYDGEETWAVTVKPGFESVPYSQSSNGIGAHTEAPVSVPPPKYLALHCRRQARCGGGYTMLADGLQFCESLEPQLRRYATEEPIEFVAAAAPGSQERNSLRVPMLDRSGESPVFRFSYNLFRYGDVNPSEDAVIAPSSPLNANPTLARLASLGEQFFNEHAASVLVPDGAMLIWDNQRMMHARSRFTDTARHLTRYWLA